MGCVVIKDRLGDVHARQLYGEANPEAIDAAARELASDVSIDAGETIQVGLCAKDDAGAARLLWGVAYADGGVERLYELSIDPEPVFTLRQTAKGPLLFIVSGPDGHLDLLARTTPETALADGAEYFARTRRYDATTKQWVLRTE